MIHSFLINCLAVKNVARETVTIEDPDAIGEQRFITLVIDALSRLLVVVRTQRGDRTRLISARKASPGESEQYHA